MMPRLNSAKSKYKAIEQSLEQSLKRRKITELEYKVFGKLTVIEGLGNGKWLCKCNCGNNTTQTGHDLINKHVISCGCLKRLSFGEASRNRIYKTYQTNARKQNLTFNLSIEEFCKLTSSNCFYCGCNPSHISKKDEREKPFGVYKHNGIDRTNNSKGYFIDNCVPCCRECNTFKLDFKLETFLCRVKKIYEHMQMSQLREPELQEGQSLIYHCK